MAGATLPQHAAACASALLWSFAPPHRGQAAIAIVHRSRHDLEIAQIDVRKGVEAQFEAKVAEAMPLFRRAKGCHAMELHRCIETPGRYRLVVQWESVEHHTVDFRQSADFAAWRALVGQYFESPPVVEHTRRVWFGFGPQASGS